MKITALVENTTNCGLKTAHGLSLYMETKNHKILFDMGPDDTAFLNAAEKNIDLSKVDIAIISHGHYDHGGALERFLNINHTAKIYAQEKAFDLHINIVKNSDIGIDKEFTHHSQIVLVNGNYKIDDELELFIAKHNDKCYSTANDTLWTKDAEDDFKHEQNLLIKEEKTALIIGCGHSGVVNILDTIKDEKIDICVGGYHLFNPTTGEIVSHELLAQVSSELKKYSNTDFYTCHCTGIEAFDYLKSEMSNMSYIACGDSVC